MTNDERMTKSELTTPMARPRKELAARSCELGDARDESSNPSARCAHALPKVLRASSFGFPLSFVIRIRHSSYSLIRGSKAYHRLPFWLFAAPTHEQLCPFLPETRPSSQIDPAFLADSSKRPLRSRTECCLINDKRTVTGEFPIS